MSNAYAERYRILPVEVDRAALTVATAEPFVRSWADELERILKLQVKLVFANPVDIRRYRRRVLQPRALDEEGAGELARASSSLARNFEQLVELGRHGQPRRQRPARRPHRRLALAVRVRAACIRHPHRAAARRRPRPLPHRRRAAPGLRDPDAGADRDDVAHQAAGADGDRRARRPQDGRIKTVAPDGEEVELRISTMPTAFGEKIVMRIFTPEVLVRDFTDLGFTADDRERWERMIKRAARHHPRHRTHGLGQDDDALLDAEAARDARGQRLHDRGSDRDDRARVQPDAGAARARRRFRAPACARCCGRIRTSSWSGEIRDRDTGRHGGPGGAHRPPGAVDAAYQRRAHRGHPHARSRHARVPDQFDAARRDGATPGAHAVPALQEARRPAGRRDLVADHRAVARRQACDGDGAGRLPRVPDDRLPRPHRPLRDHADDARASQADHA